MSAVKILDQHTFIDALNASEKSYHQRYLAMYSSVLDGIVTDPLLMLIPIDDHIVHRGDGVFEAFKCLEGNIYNVAAHLRRLRRSAGFLSLDVPGSDDDIISMVIATLRAGGKRDCLIRLYVSRGPGGFSASPSESPCPQMYIVVTVLPQPFMVTHPEGALVARSSIGPKDSSLTGIKSTNYVVNALMKRESAEKAVDFVAGFDAQGHMTEGATENMGVVTEDGRLVFPHLTGILPGTTMLRIMELAAALVERGDLSGVGMGNIPVDVIRKAREMLVVGTTIDVVAVKSYDTIPIADGKPGPVWRALNDLLQADMRNNGHLLTSAFGPDKS